MNQISNNKLLLKYLINLQSRIRGFLTRNKLQKKRSNTKDDNYQNKHRVSNQPIKIVDLKNILKFTQ